MNEAKNGRRKALENGAAFVPLEANAAIAEATPYMSRRRWTMGTLHRRNTLKVMSEIGAQWYHQFFDIYRALSIRIITQVLHHKFPQGHKKYE